MFVALRTLRDGQRLNTPLKLLPDCVRPALSLRVLLLPCSQGQGGWLPFCGPFKAALIVYQHKSDKSSFFLLFGYRLTFFRYVVGSKAPMASQTPHTSGRWSKTAPQNTQR